MNLPHGYRLLRTAPEVWILVDLHSRGLVVSRYEGEFDDEQVEKDAREHAEATKADDRRQ